MEKHKNYCEDRNIAIKSTTYLSAYIKFGCLSIREVYWKLKNMIQLSIDYEEIIV